MRHGLRLEREWAWVWVWEQARGQGRRLGVRLEGAGTVSSEVRARRLAAGPGSRHGELGEREQIGVLARGDRRVRPGRVSVSGPGPEGPRGVVECGAAAMQARGRPHQRLQCRPRECGSASARRSVSNISAISARNHPKRSNRGVFALKLVRDGGDRDVRGAVKSGLVKLGLVVRRLLAERLPRRGARRRRPRGASSTRAGSRRARPCGRSRPRRRGRGCSSARAGR